jgi:hypothetical protein
MSRSDILECLSFGNLPLNVFVFNWPLNLIIYTYIILMVRGGCEQGIYGKKRADVGVRKKGT